METIYLEANVPLFLESIASSRCQLMRFPVLPIALLFGLLLSAKTLAEPPQDKPVSGLYFAEKVEASLHVVAAGMGWWDGRLIIANREPPALDAITPAIKFEELKN